MKAEAQEVRALFEREQCLKVPVFQRPYVWSRARNWEPLWEDITNVADSLVDDSNAAPHFLGAVVLDGTEKDNDDIRVWQIIDGQQRITTLQVVLCAIRDALSNAGAPRKYVRTLEKLTVNEDQLSDAPFAGYKVWPTFRDRTPFRSIVDNSPKPDLESGLLDAYEYFHDAAFTWLAEVDLADDHIDALVKAMRKGLQLVVIELTDTDNAQVIFESLNDRGTPLLPSDLVKNSLFQSLESREADVEQVWEVYWQRLETPYWQQEIRQGRLIRSRLDAFFSHYLTMRTGTEVLSGALFTRFKDLTRGMSRDDLIDLTRSIAEASDRYRTIVTPSAAYDHSRLMAVAESLDTSVVAPIVLFLDTHADSDDRVAAYGYIESWLVRRAVLRSTSKNYNRMLLDLLQALRRSSKPYAPQVEDFFLSNTSESGRWPTDDEIHHALVRTPIYKSLTRARVRLVLSGCEAGLRGADSSMPESVDVALLADSGTAQITDTVRGSIGNLTLVRSPRPRKLSTTSDWRERRPLLFDPELAISQDLPALLSDVTVSSRGGSLAESFCRRWPHPVGAGAHAEHPNDEPETTQSTVIAEPHASAPPEQSPVVGMLHHYFSGLPVGTVARLDSMFENQTIAPSEGELQTLRQSPPPEYAVIEMADTTFIEKVSRTPLTGPPPIATDAPSQSPGEPGAPIIAAVVPGPRHSRSRTVHAGTLTDLLRGGLLVDGDEVHHEQRRKGLRHSARVAADGTLRMGGRSYSSPSTALVDATGTSRNGWTDWIVTRTGESLADLRDQLHR
ncbi:GmrSD restriction endonuclease domain-containing protein [Gordonia aichiensis]|uniref:GmrSD restriction endonuclease domain-containing protein n=1 Tax=Gordonia aichiensis TaxID=36820 RepID=UPI0032666AE7